MAISKLTAGTAEGFPLEGRRAVAALLFMQSANMSMQFYGTLNSSPWTAENFGADAEKAASCMNYVRQAIGSSMAWAIGASWIAHSIWPAVGAVIINLYLYYLYSRALVKGAVAGSTGWARP